MPASTAAPMTSKLLDSSSKYPKSIVPSAILLTRRPDRPRCAYAMPALIFASVRKGPGRDAVVRTVVRAQQRARLGVTGEGIWLVCLEVAGIAGQVTPTNGS